MYTPKLFKVKSRKDQLEFIQKNSFALILTVDSDTSIVSHIPLVCEEQGEKLLLKGHFAKANPHSKLFNEKKVTAIFQGPHGYISPSWYENSNEVPTWNYMAIHCHGTGRVFEDYQWLNQFMAELTQLHEPTGVSSEWKFDPNQDYVKKQMDRIIGFEIVVSQVEAKYKLSQNRQLKDQENIIAALEQIKSDDSMEMAQQMKSLIQSSK